MSRVNVWLYRRTGGRVGGKWRIGSALFKPVPVLLLDHRGRTSGRAYTSPLLYLQDGPNVVIVASQGGLPRNPQWYHNLAAHPETTIQIRSRGTPRARPHRHPRRAGGAVAAAGRALRRLRELPALDRPRRSRS